MLLRVGKCLCAVLLFLLCGGVAQAQRAAGACTGPKPACDVCNRAVCTADTAPNWTCEADAAGTSCNTGNACFKNGRCDGAGSCVGTLACVPGIPGPITGPTSSTSGSYALSWGASTGVVDQYRLFQNGAQIFNGDALSANVVVKNAGTYSYHVQACNSVGCSSTTPDFAVAVLFPPDTPEPFKAPQETGPNYTITWGAPSGPVTQYDFGESSDGTTWTTTGQTVTSKSFVNRPYGEYFYRVRACNSSGCSAYSAVAQVSVITALVSIPDDPVVPPSVAVPEQCWVGTVPATASVEGGAATYRIPIAVPPGRAGMAPDLSLSYSSRNGNGVAGVGWSISTRSTIYRCPRTLAQDGGNRTVQHDALDRLCLDGERLVTSNDASYGMDRSEYRTELDHFSRITLHGGTSAWASFFEVEKKSGRISQYEPGPLSDHSLPPDVWYLVREFDRQGNCVVYSYSSVAARGALQDVELTAITYTGTRPGNGNACVTVQSSPGARVVKFEYATHRTDARTTYRYGGGSMMAALLTGITTQVSEHPVRHYELGYTASQTTGRYLLASITVCGGAACSDGNKLPPTTFQYQSANLTFDSWHVERNGQPLTQNWWVQFVGDLDGDGIRDRVYRYANVGEPVQADLELSAGGTESEVGSTPFWNGFVNANNATPLGSQADMDNDGRVDVLGATTAGKLQFASATSNGGGGVNWTRKTTNLPLPLGPQGTYFAEGIDYNGDGIIDVRFVDSSFNEHIALHGNKDPLDWTNLREFSAPVAPAHLSPMQVRDLNGDGLVDTMFDDAPLSGALADATQVAFFNGAIGSPFPYTYFKLGPCERNADGTILGNCDDALPDIGGPPGSPGNNPTRGWIDVNGDGLPDVYDFGPGANGPVMFVNKGGPIGSKLFERVEIVGPTLDPKRLSLAFAVDIDGDGQEELLVPTHRVRDYCVCVGNLQCKLKNGEPGTFCGNDFDTIPAAFPYRSQDRSLFAWDAYKFQEANGTYVMRRFATNLILPANFPVDKLDIDGDGMVDFVYRLMNDRSGRGKYLDTADSELGPYIARSQTPAPDLLVGVTDGLGATASWIYRPLSDSPDPKAQDKVAEWEKSAGCDLPAQETFYVAHHDAARAPGHAYFTSSMSAVARFDVSNGLGSGANVTCFRYQDAMLNTEGRGFQGFRIIVAEEQLPVAAGEDVPNLKGCAGVCSPNNLRTTSTFYQEFPLTSKLNAVAVVSRASGAPLHQTTFFWHVANGALGSTIVYSSGTVAREYDATGPLAKQMTTVSEIDLVSGEATRTCAIYNGATPNGSLRPQDLITRETRTLANDTSPGVWWLARIFLRERLSDFLTNPFSLNETCTVTGSGRCATAPPACPALPASKTAKSETTIYRWNDDNAAPGSRRRLRMQQINALGTAGTPAPPGGGSTVPH